MLDYVFGLVQANQWHARPCASERFRRYVDNKHLKNIFSAGELVEEAVISILETTAVNGLIDAMIVEDNWKGRSSQGELRRKTSRRFSSA
jgi:hypothetical protein